MGHGSILHQLNLRLPSCRFVLCAGAELTHYFFFDFARRNRRTAENRFVSWVYRRRVILSGVRWAVPAVLVKISPGATLGAPATGSAPPHPKNPTRARRSGRLRDDFRISMATVMGPPRASLRGEWSQFQLASNTTKITAADI